MKSVCFFFVSFLLSSSIVFASEVPSEKTIQAVKAECQKQHSKKTTTDVLLLGHCLLSVNIKVMELRQKAGDEKVEKELETLRLELRTISVQLRRAERLAKRDEAKAKPTEPAAKPVAPPAEQPRPASMYGAPYMVIDAPGRYSASTVDSPEFTSRLHVKELRFSARKVLGWGAQQARVVFMKNGMPLAVAHPGAIPFNEFYADMDQDGRPDRITYKGVDPAFVDSVFIPYTQGDRIEIVFLASTGKYVAVNGLPPLPLWGTPRRFVVENIPGAGKWQIVAFAATEL